MTKQKQLEVQSFHPAIHTSFLLALAIQCHTDTRWHQLTVILLLVTPRESLDPLRICPCESFLPATSGSQLCKAAAHVLTCEVKQHSQVIHKLALMFHSSPASRLIVNVNNFKPFSTEIQHLMTFFHPMASQAMWLSLAFEATVPLKYFSLARQ